MSNSNKNQVEDLKTYKTYKVRTSMVVHTYIDVVAPSEDEAKWEVYDIWECDIKHGGDLSFFKKNFDNIIYAEPEDLQPVLGLYECKDYHPVYVDGRKPSETKECA